MALAHKKISLEDFLLLPEEEPALEYVNGEVSQKVSPKLKHGVLQSHLVERINRAARRQGGALAVTEVRATFGGQSTVPDVSVYQRQRTPRDPSGEVTDDVFIPPDIAIEIVSPRQSVNALLRRCRWYVANGVEIAMLVDPSDKSVLSFWADGTVHEWTGVDRMDLGDIVPGLALTVEELFKALSE